MTISVELQRIYSSAPVNVTWYDAIQLSHPNWTETISYITNTIEERTFNLFGVPVLFKPATFKVTMPTRNDFGVVEFQISFPVTTNTINLIDLAENSGTPITATLTTYIDASDEPQLEPITLFMDQVTLNAETGTGNAKRIDLLNKAFPRNIVRALTYPGLLR